MLSTAAAASAGYSVASTSSGPRTNGHGKVNMSSAFSSGNGSPAPETTEGVKEEFSNGGEEAADQETREPSQEVDIVINNVVGSFSVKCHLNLRDIALRGLNVEYRRENGVGRSIFLSE